MAPARLFGYRELAALRRHCETKRQVALKIIVISSAKVTAEDSQAGVEACPGVILWRREQTTTETVAAGWR